MIDIIHIIVALFAALLVTILGLFQNITFFDLSKQLIVVIPVFFIIGLIYRYYMRRLLELDKKSLQNKNDGEDAEASDSENTEDEADGKSLDDAQKNSDTSNDSDIFDDFDNLGM